MVLPHSPGQAGGVRVQTPEGEELFFYVSGGMLEIQPKAITVLPARAGLARGSRERRRHRDRPAELARISAQVALLQKIKESAGLG